MRNFEDYVGIFALPVCIGLVLCACSSIAAPKSSSPESQSRSEWINSINSKYDSQLFVPLFPQNKITPDNAIDDFDRYVSKENAQEIGNFVGADTVIYGSLASGENEYQITITGAITETGQMDVIDISYLDNFEEE